MGIGEMHAKAYHTHPLCNLKSLCDFDSFKLNDLKLKYRECELYKDANQIINDDYIDIVSVASFDNFHADQIIRLIENQTHVMAEKPLCMSLEELKAIHSTLKSNPNVCLSSNLVLRTNSRFRKFKGDIKDKRIGNVFYIEADYYWGRINKLSGWRAEMNYYSIILGAAIHMVDLVMWMTGMRPISVQAVGNNIATTSSALKYNSFSAILLKFENGLIAKITGNGGCVHPHFHGVKIFGTNRTVVHELNSAYYINSSDPKLDIDVITSPYPEKEVREKIIHSFVNYIHDNSIKPVVTQAEVFDVMSACFAAEEAMKTGETIKIKYLN